MANYQTALDSVTYFNTSDNPSGASRTVTIITNDGAAKNSVAVTDTMLMSPRSTTRPWPMPTPGW